MKVQKIYVKNLKAAAEMSADFNGCHAIITGGNNKGKSSFLKTFVERIRGNKPEEIIKKDETEAYCLYELTDGSKFEWILEDGKNEKLIFTTADGLEIKSGVITNVGKKYFGQGFDIDSFLTSSSREQKKQLQKLLNIDLDEIEARHKKAYDERTQMNAILRSEKAKLTGTTRVNPNSPVVDLDALQEKIIDGEKKNQNIEHVTQSIKEAEQQILELQEKVTKGEARLKDNTPVDLTDLRQQVLDGKKTNELHQNNKDIENQELIIGKVKKEREALDKQVKTIEQEKTEVLKEAKMPEGFDFTEDGITFNGFPLNKETLSSSQIYIASLKLAAESLGAIKTLTFDASYLDKNSLKEVEQRATANDLQLLIERPDFDGGELQYQLLA